MKKMLCTVVSILLVAGLMVTCAGERAFAIYEPFSVFGRELHVKGSLQTSLEIRTHRDARDVQFSSQRTDFRIEGDYRWIQNEESDVRIFGLFALWYDAASNIEDNLKDTIRFEDSGSHALKNSRYSNQEPEIIKELYIDISKEKWELRLGKQSVFWGETAGVQVADVVSPLDVTNLKLFGDFEDFKIGLWMARLYLMPQGLWADMSFEFICVPFEFQPTRLPPYGNGTFFGTAVHPVPGFVGNILGQQRHDAPGYDIDNAEFGFRIRGFLFGADWTLHHYYSRQDDALIDRGKGFANFVALTTTGRFGGRVYTYPKYHSTAITISTTQPKFKSTMRYEFVLNNKKFQAGAYDIESGNEFLSGVAFNKNFFIPWLTPKNRNRHLTTELAWFHNHFLSDMSRVRRTAVQRLKWGDGRHSSSDVFQMQLDYGFLYDTITQRVSVQYNRLGWTSVSLRFIWNPAEKWRFTVLYQQRNEQGRARHLSDQVYLSTLFLF